MPEPTIKMRLKQRDGKIWLRALMRHPMETGLRKDGLTGLSIPPHYIRQVTVEANHEVVFSADWSTSISKNPFLFIQFDGADGDAVRLTWTDNTGATESIEKVVGRR